MENINVGQNKVLFFSLQIKYVKWSHVCESGTFSACELVNEKKKTLMAIRRIFCNFHFTLTEQKAFHIEGISALSEDGVILVELRLYHVNKTNEKATGFMPHRCLVAQQFGFSTMRK